MNKKAKRIRLALVLAAITLLAYFAGRIPFYLFEEKQLHTNLEEFFSLEHIARMTPLFLIIGISAVLIVLILAFQKRFFSADPLYRKRVSSSSKSRKRRAAGQGRSVFMTIRWAVMGLFSFFVMVGGILLQTRFGEISMPVLACATNRDQLIETSCYYLAHLTALTEEFNLGGLALFLISTVGFALLLGRIICGFLCPMGLAQDLMHVIRRKTKREGVTMNEERYKKLVPIRWLMIILMIGLSFAGADFCSFCPALAISPAVAGLKVSLYLSGFMMILVLVGSFFKRRLWCNICPLGYLIGLAHKISPFRLKKDTTACTECGACYEACPMGIKMIYTEREKTDVTDTTCILCGECIRCCPEDNALALTFAGKKLYAASRKQILAGYRPAAVKRYETSDYRPINKDGTITTIVNTCNNK